jgi:hypothetical protein
LAFTILYQGVVSVLDLGRLAHDIITLQGSIGIRIIMVQEVGAKAEARSCSKGLVAKEQINQFFVLLFRKNPLHLLPKEIRR